MFKLLQVLRRLKLLIPADGSKRGDRVPLTLQDCLETNTKNKRSVWKIFLLIILLLSVFYYLMCNQVSVVPTHPYFEVFPEDEVKIVSEKVRMNDLFKYEKNPQKIYKILAEAEKRKRYEITESTENPPHIRQIQRDDLPMCISRARLQNVSIHKAERKSLETWFSVIAMGGYYTPPDCRSRHKVAILVPYRNRRENLAVFLYNIHPFLIRQKLEYRIFVVEQYGSDLFNRGRLFNAGYLELQKMGSWPCVVFHDVDLLPTDDRILYTCPTIPRHMCATVLEKEQLPKYRTLFGGVAAMTADQYNTVNGYSNMYWGWGGEDNDMFWRLKVTGLGMTRYTKNIARYTALPHNSTPVNQYRFNMLKTGMERYKEDGLSSVQYAVVSYDLRRLYTHILIDINPRRENVTALLMAFNKSIH